MKKEYVTKEEMHQEFIAFEARMDAKIDAKFEQFTQEILSILNDFMSHIDARFNAIEKELKQINRHLYDHDGRIATVESKLDQVGVVLT